MVDVIRISSRGYTIYITQERLCSGPGLFRRPLLPQRIICDFLFGCTRRQRVRKLFPEGPPGKRHEHKSETCIAKTQRTHYKVRVARNGKWVQQMRKSVYCCSACFRLLLIPGCLPLFFWLYSSAIVLPSFRVVAYAIRSLVILLCVCSSFGPFFGVPFHRFPASNPTLSYSISFLFAAPFSRAFPPIFMHTQWVQVLRGTSYQYICWSKAVILRAKVIKVSSPLTRHTSNPFWCTSICAEIWLPL